MGQNVGPFLDQLLIPEGKLIIPGPSVLQHAQQLVALLDNSLVAL